MPVDKVWTYVWNNTWSLHFVHKISDLSEVREMCPVWIKSTFVSMSLLQRIDIHLGDC